MLLRCKKPRGRRNLIIASMRARTVERIATAICRDTWLPYVRPAMQRVDARKFHGVPTRQDPRAIGMRSLRLPYAVTNAKVQSTLLGSVLPG